MKKFEYRYSAPTEEERREIESIRAAYVTDERTKKLETLRRLDGLVRRVPSAVAFAMGTAGLLAFGLGMAMVLSWSIFAGGIAVAAVGIVPMALAAPVYNAVLRRQKKKYGDEIVRLSEELLGR